MAWKLSDSRRSSVASAGGADEARANGSARARMNVRKWRWYAAHRIEYGRISTKRKRAEWEKSKCPLDSSEHVNQPITWFNIDFWFLSKFLELACNHPLLLITPLYLPPSDVRLRDWSDLPKDARHQTGLLQEHHLWSARSYHRFFEKLHPQAQMEARYFEWNS